MDINDLTLGQVKEIQSMCGSGSASAPKKCGRAVIVVDRGWIWAGDVTEENGRIYLDRAVWVFRWESIVFAKMIENPKDNKVDLRKLDNRVDIPKSGEIFRVPVAEDWGL